jgi:Lysophospholipase L1 and related esterases
MNLLLLIALLVAGTFSSAFAAGESNKVIRVACLGDSITFGAGVTNRSQNAYPAQLARILGENWEVKNHGVSGTTLMNAGDRPYQATPKFKAALESKPDVAVIALGTNDSKPQNFESNPNDFVPSYRNLISKLREANPEIVVYLCLPVPPFPESYGIRDSVITEKIIPKIREVALEEKLALIDLHSALKGRHDCFPDKIHPNESGARIIAETVAAAISKNTTQKN